MVSGDASDISSQSFPLTLKDAITQIVPQFAQGDQTCRNEDGLRTSATLKDVRARGGVGLNTVLTIAERNMLEKDMFKKQRQ